jgi:CheY-like chemotaxis protein
MRILLAEDNTINAKVATLFLTKMGHSTVVAKNGREVLHALEHNPFDVVLMDLEMPELSGSEAIQMIRTGENSRIDKTIPIFALSAHSRDEVEELYPDLEIEGYINKPLDKNQLAEILDKVQVAP